MLYQCPVCEVTWTRIRYFTMHRKGTLKRRSKACSDCVRYEEWQRAQNVSKTKKSAAKFLRV